MSGAGSRPAAGSISQDLNGSGSVLCSMLCVVNVCPVHSVDLN